MTWVVESLQASTTYRSSPDGKWSANTVLVNAMECLLQVQALQEHSLLIQLIHQVSVGLRQASLKGIDLILEVGDLGLYLLDTESSGP